MTKMAGETFEISLNEANATVTFRGALRLTGTEEYATILDLLKRTLDLGSDQIVVNVVELEFLNSSGITMFSRFVIEARERSILQLRFEASNSIPWHARSLKNLQRLMPTLQIHFV